MAESKTWDFVVVGAGLSGINAAYRLKTGLPTCSLAILEARDTIGGTWAFFKYPGVRADSSLTMLGFEWRPWPHDQDIADASLIQAYLKDAARDEGINKLVKLNHRVIGSNWSSAGQRWHLKVNVSENEEVELKAKFIIWCTGYFSYEKAFSSVIPGLDDFKGTVAHPQFWPQDLNYADKQVVVIGSGATAITLLPALAKTAAKVTMLQRSPSYVVGVPAITGTTLWLRKWLPKWLAWPLIWTQDFVIEQVFIQFCLKFPNAARKALMSSMKAKLPKPVDVDVHFNPRYPPMDQRLLLCPDDDFFKALHRENTQIVTDTITTVTSDGILTSSGRKIEADVIVTATGLHVQLFGGMVPTVDGKPIDIENAYTWRGVMMTGLPNAASPIGYETSSWTLGADVSTILLIQVLKRMRRIGATSVTPVFDGDAASPSKPVLPNSSTYFLAARRRLPRITGDATWYGRISPQYDYWKLWFGSITKGLQYTLPNAKTK